MSMSGVPGQPRTKRFLRQIVRTGRIPHALLFSGPSGSGKTTLAKEFAKTLNCLNVQDFDCCDACSSCRKADEGNHPDLIHILSEGAYIRLPQIHGLQERCRYRPFEGRYRMISIEDAQNLRDEAANALLKLLEEPPAQNIFLLTVPEPQMLLPTIVSRCCHVRFQPLDDSYVARHIEETFHIPETRARELAFLAEGSLEKARLLTDENHIAHWRQVLESVRTLRTLSMLDFFALTTQWARDTEDLEQDLKYIKLWIRDIILTRLGIGREAVFEPNAELLDSVENASAESLFELYGCVEEALRDLRQNANKQLVLEGVCLAIKKGLYGQGSGDTFSKGRQGLSL